MENRFLLPSKTSFSNDTNFPSGETGLQQGGEKWGFKQGEDGKNRDIVPGFLRGKQGMGPLTGAILTF